MSDDNENARDFGENWMPRLSIKAFVVAVAVAVSLAVAGLGARKLFQKDQTNPTDVGNNVEEDSAAVQSGVEIEGTRTEQALAVATDRAETLELGKELEQKEDAAIILAALIEASKYSAWARDEVKHMHDVSVIDDFREKIRGNAAAEYLADKIYEVMEATNAYLEGKEVSESAIIDETEARLNIGYALVINTEIEYPEGNRMLLTFELGVLEEARMTPVNVPGVEAEVDSSIPFKPLVIDEKQAVGGGR